MSRKSPTTSEIFHRSTCGLCYTSGVSQYFNVNDNFIDYNGIFLSFREILTDTLDFKVRKKDTKTMFICLDCKDKVIKFYHFKRKIKEVRKQNVKKIDYKINPQQNLKEGKVVLNILKIVQDYTKKHLISSIRVDENSTKLVIESQEKPKTLIQKPVQETAFGPLEFLEIKHEPELILTVAQDKGPEICYEKNFINSKEANDDESEYDDNSRFYESSEPGPSNSIENSLALEMENVRNQTDDGFQRFRKDKAQRQKRMAVLKLPKNRASYEKHKAQARERTRRYRAKRREQQNMKIESNQISDGNSSRFCHPSSPSFPFHQFAEVKLEEVSGDDAVIVS